MKAFLALTTAVFLTACAYRPDLSRDLDHAVSELDRGFWSATDVIPSADVPAKKSKPALPPLK